MSSQSTTPQNSKNHEQEDLRKKELAIQAMRRQIAELEQRKKAKLTTPSGTQSPLALSSSGSSQAEMPVGVDMGISSASLAEPAAVADLQALETMIASETVAPNPNMQTTPTRLSQDSLASMDAAQLDIVRSKIIRKNEIESGLPALEAEIQSTEAKLTTFTEEKEKLLSEIARGKEGHRQLLDELHHLVYEINGLSLEEVDAAQHRSMIKEPLPGPDQGIPPLSKI
jgi:hypothetical protein